MAFVVIGENQVNRQFQHYVAHPIQIISGLSMCKEITYTIYTVGHNGGIIIFTPNYLLNDFDNVLFLIDLDNSIHSQILLNDNWGVFVLRDC